MTARPCAAGVTVLAVLAAFMAAPHAHVHQAITENEAHSETRTLRHAHLTGHPHHDEPADGEPTDDAEHDSSGTHERVWHVNDFVFQQIAPLQAPLPALIALPATCTPGLASWRVVASFHPEAHAPPLVFSRSLRGPPSFPPLFL